MKSSKHLIIYAFSLLVLAGLAGCDTKPGSTESAGRKLNQSANEAGRKIGETVDKVGVTLSDQSAKTNLALNDAEITARVKAAIFAEPGLQTLQIRVETVNGVVTLSGSAESQPISERARGLAGAVTGVTRVENNLVLKLN